MSLLWPEKIRIGLFPGQCWLERGRSHRGAPVDLGRVGGPASLIRALESLLEQATGTLRKGSHVAICVSDSVGPTITLPWQEVLWRREEQQNYARLCFEQYGIEILHDQWVTHCQFRRHRAGGLAFALPRPWTKEVIAVLSERGLQLSSVRPISAVAYSRQPMREKAGKTIVLIHELQRFNALVYEANNLVACDVEPVTGHAQHAGVRLVRRISARHGEIARMKHWSPGARADLTFLASSLPQAASDWLERGSWV